MAPLPLPLALAVRMAGVIEILEVLGIGMEHRPPRLGMETQGLPEFGLAGTTTSRDMLNQLRHEMGFGDEV